MFSEDMYNNSAYNKKLGQTNQAKGYWDWLADPNREGFAAGDVASAQNAGNQMNLSRGLNAQGTFTPLNPDASGGQPIPNVMAQYNQLSGQPTSNVPPTNTPQSQPQSNAPIPYSPLSNQYTPQVQPTQGLRTQYQQPKLRRQSFSTRPYL